MSYGKLKVVKTYGEKPLFVIVGREGQESIPIPDLTEWLMKRLDHTINMFVSDKYFQVADEDYKE